MDDQPFVGHRLVQGQLCIPKEEKPAKLGGLFVYTNKYLWKDDASGICGNTKAGHLIMLQ